MKTKYRNYSRIAIVLAIIISIAITKKVNELSGAGILISFFSSVISFTNLFFLIINYKKDKAIDRKFGFVKISGDRWLGYDGFWHEGFKEIYAKKIDQYYSNGGDDLGYTSSFYMSIVSVYCCLAVAFVIGHLFKPMSSDAIIGAILGAGFTLYFIIRRAVFG